MSNKLKNYIHLRVDDSTLEKLKELSSLLQTTYSNVLRDLIDKEYSKQMKKGKK